MLNKKVIIILAVILFIASTALVFFLAKQNGNKAIVNQVDSKLASELKNNYSGLSSAQLKFFADTAAKGGIDPCLGRKDESACVFSVAFIKGDFNICNVADFNNKALYQECAGAVLKKKATEEINQCEFLLGDDYYNCLGAIFVAYNEKQDCTGLTDLGARAICEDFFNYKTVYYNYNREACQTIKNDKLNQYCLKNIIDKK